MLWNQTLAQAWDLLCHHLVVRLKGEARQKGSVPNSRAQPLSSVFCPLTFPQSPLKIYFPGLGLNRREVLTASPSWALPKEFGSPTNVQLTMKSLNSV